jgi:hypothetical protein
MKKAWSIYISFTLKLTVLATVTGILAACSSGLLGDSSPTATYIPLPSATIEIEPTKTRTATLSPSATITQTMTPLPTHTPTEQLCLTLLEPENGTELSAFGIITFRWSEQPGATSYILKILLPTGRTNEFDLEATSIEKYMGSLPVEGEYFWQVEAFDDQGEFICASVPFSFSKPKTSSP